MRKRRCLPLLFVLAVTLSFARAPQTAASDAPDTASEYLQAWSFHDYAAMRSLSSQAVQNQLSATQFSAAAAALSPPASEPTILSRTRRDDGTHVYFEYQTAGSAATQRGAIVLRPEGRIEQPELLVRQAGSPPSSQAAPGPASAPQQAAPTLPSPAAGQSAQAILKRMTDITGHAQTLRAQLALRGSVMGQTINESGVLLYKQPNQFHMRMKSMVMNSTGMKSILYLPEANIYMELSQLGSFEFAPGIGESPQALESKYKVRLAGEQTLNGEAAYELLMTPPQSATSGLLSSGEISLLVSARSGLPLQSRSSGLSVTYSGWEINSPAVTDKDFVFTPPAGATELSLGSILGALGGSGSGQLPQIPQ